MKHDGRDPEAENEGRLLLIAVYLAYSLVIGLVAVALLWVGAGQ